MNAQANLTRSGLAAQKKMTTEPADFTAFSISRTRKTAVSFVLDRIKEAIVRGELMPGDVLPSEAELSSKLGVGKTSIREAIKMLLAVGAVDIRQGYGTVIRTEPGPDMLTPLVFQLLLKEGTVPIRLSPTPTICMAWRRVAREGDKAGMDVSQREDLSFPRSLPEFQRLFPDGTACAA